MSKKVDNGDKVFRFSDLKDIEFLSSRGLSPMSVSLTVEQDGSFHGEYSEREERPTSPEYPNGMLYECKYKGKFTSLCKTGPSEYTMKGKSLQIEGSIGEEKKVDGTKVITTEPYGFQNADIFKVHLPGKIDANHIDNYEMVNMSTGDKFFIPAG